MYLFGNIRLGQINTGVKSVYEPAGSLRILWFNSLPFKCCMKLCPEKVI